MTSSSCSLLPGLYTIDPRALGSLGFLYSIIGSQGPSKIVTVPPFFEVDINAANEAASKMQSLGSNTSLQISQYAWTGINTASSSSTLSINVTQLPNSLLAYPEGALQGSPLNGWQVQADGKTSVLANLTNFMIHGILQAKSMRSFANSSAGQFVFYETLVDLGLLSITSSAASITKVESSKFRLWVGDSFAQDMKLLVRKTVLPRAFAQ